MLFFLILMPDDSGWLSFNLNLIFVVKYIKRYFEMRFCSAGCRCWRGVFRNIFFCIYFSGSVMGKMGVVLVKWRIWKGFAGKVIFVNGKNYKNFSKIQVKY